MQTFYAGNTFLGRVSKGTVSSIFTRSFAMLFLFCFFAFAGNAQNKIQTSGKKFTSTPSRVVSNSIITETCTITCPANITVPNTTNQCGAVVTFPLATVSNCVPPAALTQSTSNAIVGGNSISCNSGLLHTDNGYFRSYTLSYAIPVVVNSVTFGIELADAAGTGTTQPVEVRVYTSAGAFPGGTLTQVASETYNIPDQSGTLFTANFTTPATIPGNSIMVLEVFTPNGQVAGHSFFIGSNSAGQSAPTYIRAAACGVANPTDVATIGFPDMHAIIDATVTGVPTVTASPASGSFFPKGATTVTQTATDLDGNTSTCTFTVTVNDTQAPTITCPANITTNATAGQCAAVVNYTLPTATDNCPGVGLLNVPIGAAPANAFNGVTFDVTNNSASPLTITGFNAPISSGTHPVEVYYTTSASTAIGNEQNAANWTLLGTANVTGGGAFPNSAIVNVPIGGLVLAPGQSKGIYIALTDGGEFGYANGNQTVSNGTLTVTSNNHRGGAYPFVNANFPRLFYGDVLYSSTSLVVVPVRIAGPASGSSFPVGVTTVTHRATDAAGNTADCSFTVTVVDNQAPVITCPANMTVGTDAGLCSAVVNFAPTATDNCSNISLTQSASTAIVALNSVACTAGPNSFWRAYQLAAPLPVTIRTVTFAIEAANSSQTVNVRVHTSAGAFPGGVRTQVASQAVTVGPANNNSLVTVTLTTPPTVPGNAILVLEINTPATPNSLWPGSNPSGESGPSYITNCGTTTPVTLASLGFPGMHIILNATGTVAVPIVSVPASGSVFPIGTTTVTSTATDAAGNSSSCTFTVTVNDTQNPTVTCPASVTRPTDAGVCTSTYTPPAPTQADNCGVVTRTWALTGATTGASAATGINTVGSTAFNIGVTTVTYTVRDAAGNTGTCSFTVTVTDAVLPTITAQPVNRTVCAGATATFSVTAVTAPTAGGPLSYLWQQWNGTAWVTAPGTANAATYSVANTTQSMNTNTFRVVVTGLCTPVNSNAATLFVNALPTISLTSSSSPVLLPGQTTSIIANVNPTGGTFAWFKNGVPRVPTVTGGTLANLSVDDAGTYRTTYTDPNGCVVTSGDLVISAEASNRLIVAPNPNYGQFWVRYYNQTGETLTVIVFDAKGRRVHQQQSSAGLPYTRIDVDMGLQAGGVYVVELRGNDGRLLGRKQIIVGQR